MPLVHTWWVSSLEDGPSDEVVLEVVLFRSRMAVPPIWAQALLRRRLCSSWLGLQERIWSCMSDCSHQQPAPEVPEPAREWNTAEDFFEPPYSMDVELMNELDAIQEGQDQHE